LLLVEARPLDQRRWILGLQLKRVVEITQRDIGLALLGINAPAQQQRVDVVRLKAERVVKISLAFDQPGRFGIESPARGVGTVFVGRKRDGLIEALKRQIGVGLIGRSATQFDKAVSPAGVGGHRLFELLQRALGIAELLEDAATLDKQRRVAGLPL